MEWRACPGHRQTPMRHTRQTWQRAFFFISQNTRFYIIMSSQLWLNSVLGVIYQAWCELNKNGGDIWGDQKVGLNRCVVWELSFEYCKGRPCSWLATGWSFPWFTAAIKSWLRVCSNANIVVNIHHDHLPNFLTLADILGEARIYVADSTLSVLQTGSTQIIKY